MQNKDKMKAQPKGRVIDSEQVEFTVIKTGRLKGWWRGGRFKENRDKKENFAMLNTIN